MKAPEKLNGTTQVKRYLPQLVNAHMANDIVYNYPHPMLYLDFYDLFD